MTHRPRSQYDVVVIGAGQSGLAAGHHLAAAAIDHVILERATRIGDVWRSRYDSLRLYSPAGYDSLPVLPFPREPHEFPRGREMGDYLETYARHFGLPVQTGVTAERLERAPAGGFVLRTSAGDLHAAQVIIATGPFQHPRVPDFATELDGGIVQLHSSDYRHPGQLADGPVLVVGASHSGADIAYELAPTRKTYLSGRGHGQLPFSVDGRLGRLTWPVVAVAASRILSFDTPIGRRLGPAVRMGGGPLLRHRRGDLLRAGVDWLETRTVGVTRGMPTLAEGQVLEVANVVWCTGFRPDYSWVEPPIVGEDSWPRQRRGVVESTPGLYVLGVPFLHSFASMLVLGAGPDARYVVERIRAFGGVPSATAA